MRGDYRLVPAALAAWGAAGVAIGAGEAPPVLAAAVAGWVAAAAVGAVLLLRPGRWRPAGALAVIALAAASLAGTSAVAGIGARHPAVLDEAAASGRVVTLELVVTGRAEEGRLPAEAMAVELAGRRVELGRVPVLVFADGGPVGAPIGSGVSVDGALRAAEAGDDRAWLVFARGAPRLLAPAPPLLEAADGLRAGFRDVATGLPAPGGGLLPGLALGDTTAVDAALDRDMKRSSLSHLTAVSGANCAVVVTLVFALAGALGLRRGLRIGAALAALAGFVVLVTPEPSVLRAAAMAAAALAGLALGRASRGLPLLCLSVVLLLAVDPWLARSYGFALSVLATAWLLLLAGPLADALSRLLPRPLALVVAVPLSAQLACQPVILLLDPSLAVWGVPANVLAAPAAPAATVLGLLGCLLLPVLPWAGDLLAAVAWLPAAWIAEVARFFAALPLARGPWPEGAGGVALLALLGLAAAVAVWPGAGRRPRGAAAGLVILALVAYPLSVGAGRIAELAGRPADWRYALCDVGQGDALVVRDGSATALVDTGPDPEALAVCLDELGVGRLELLVLTHYDADHAGGAEAVLGRVELALLGPPDGPADEALAAALAAQGARVEFPLRGARGRLGELGWELLWPPRGTPPGNGASLVLRFEPAGACAGCLGALALGDLGEIEQARMLAAARPGRVDVVKVAHHGSADQSAALYARLRAAVGLIGVGENDYGHPTETLLGMLAAAGTAAFRSDRHGLVLVAPGDAPGTLRVWTGRGPP